MTSKTKVRATVATARKQVRGAVEFHSVHSKAKAFGHRLHDVESPVIVRSYRSAPNELTGEFNRIDGNGAFKHAATVTAGQAPVALATVAGRFPVEQ